MIWAMLKINGVNPLYLITENINGYIEESSGNKYILKRYEEQWTKIRDLIKSKTYSTENYDERIYKNWI